MHGSFCRLLGFRSKLTDEVFARQDVIVRVVNVQSRHLHLLFGPLDEIVFISDPTRLVLLGKRTSLQSASHPAIEHHRRSRKTRKSARSPGFLAI